jgi:hypothetical protein
MSHVGAEMSHCAGVACPITGVAFLLSLSKLREGPVEVSLVEQ